MKTFFRRYWVTVFVLSVIVFTSVTMSFLVITPADLKTKSFGAGLGVAVAIAAFFFAAMAVGRPVYCDEKIGPFEWISKLAYDN